jgi:hypothetical protein
MAILKVANIHFDAAGTTLIRANGANVLTFNTAGTEDVRIDATGNVLIGRTNSTVGQGVKLDVNGAINASAFLVNGTLVSTISNTYATAVGTSGNSYATAVGISGNTYANTIGTSGNTYAAAYAVTIGTSGNSYTTAVGTSGNNYATAVGISGNSYANAIGTSGNTYATAYAVSVGTSGNSYTTAVGTSGNNYATAVGISGNTYANTIGAAANGWSNTKLSNTSGISFNGNLTVPGEFTVGGNLIFDTTTATRIWEPAVNTLAIFTTQTERMRIDATGNVLIGRIDSTVGLGVKLDVVGAINCSNIFVNGSPVGGGGASISVTDQSSVNPLQYLTFTTTTTGTASSLNVATTKLTFNVATGTLSSTIFNSTSDINKKTNVRSVENSLEIIDALNGYRFDWKDNGMPSLGVIAQEVKTVLPELISEDNSVNYNGLIAVLIQAVKELKAEIEVLKNR